MIPRHPFPTSTWETPILEWRPSCERQELEPPLLENPPQHQDSELCCWKEEEKEMEEHQDSREFPPRLRCTDDLPATTTRRHDDDPQLVATPTTVTGPFQGQAECGPRPDRRVRRDTPARVQALVHRRGNQRPRLRERQQRRQKSPFRALAMPRDRHETTGSFRALAVPRDRHETTRPVYTPTG